MKGLSSRTAAWIGWLASAPGWFWGDARAAEDYELAPVHYYESRPEDAMARLRRNIEDGVKVPPATNVSRESLRWLLGELEVPEASQVLVFSKTSAQNDRIDPDHPRAIYFSDSCYVGWVQGGKAEVACVEANLGMVFYTVDFRGNSLRPRVDRPEDCLTCHGSVRTGRVPGVLVRSVYPDARGFPVLALGTFQTTDASPLEERWGGWYVTGRHGGMVHLGNAWVDEEAGIPRVMNPAAGNRWTLDGLVNTASYLRSTSDIVALMVLEHQTSMQNSLTRASMQVRTALYRQRMLYEETGRVAPREPEGSALSVIEHAAEDVLERLLFLGETELKDGGVEGSGDFQEAFRAARKENRDGRSLRDFQLLTRLFKYRCSYMIYSESFQALPNEVKEGIYQRLWAVLRNGDPEGKFAYLSGSERERIFEILTETLDGRPSWWTG